MQKHTNNPMASSKKKQCARRKEKADKKRETKRTHMRQQRDMKLKLKDPEIAAAKTLCQTYMGRDILPAPPFRDKQTKRKFSQITVGSDCSGVGTDVVAVKQACIKKGIAVDFKFMSEADPSTRKMHSALGQYHGLKPQAKVSDLVNAPSIKDMDLYIAGPPCPSYSTLNARGAGGDDARGTVLYHVCQYIMKNKPKTFVIENVAGLMRKHPKDFAVVLTNLSTAGYQVTWDIVNSLQSGCAQSRPRIYVIGLRNDRRYHQFTWPQDIKMVAPLDMFLDQKPNAKLPAFNATESRNYKAWDKKIKKMGMSLQSTTFMMDLGAGKQFGQCTQDKSPCITRARGGSMGYFISNQNRYTNLHDLGRLQGFTTKEVDAIIASGISEKQIGAAIGNAMNKMVLDRLLPKVLWAAGLSGDTKIEDPWKKFDWRKCKMMPDGNKAHFGL